MKKQIFSICFLAGLMFSLSSCGKDREEIKAAIAETQISYLIESALQESMDGLSAQVAMMTDMAQQQVSEQCGVTKDSTIVTDKQTVIGSAHYTTQYSWTLACTNDLSPLNFDFICHSTGTYNNNRMSSNDAGDANWALTGLSAGVNEFTANGIYTRNGEQTFKAEGIITESNLNVVVSNLKVDKGSQKITGGTAEVNVHGSADSGESFDFDGKIVFLGNGKAKVTVNGKTFVIGL